MAHETVGEQFDRVIKPLVDDFLSSGDGELVDRIAALKRLLEPSSQVFTNVTIDSHSKYNYIEHIRCYLYDPHNKKEAEGHEPLGSEMAENDVRDAILRKLHALVEAKLDSKTGLRARFNDRYRLPSAPPLQASREELQPRKTQSPSYTPAIGYYNTSYHSPHLVYVSGGHGGLGGGHHHGGGFFDCCRGGSSGGGHHHGGGSSGCCRGGSSGGGDCDPRLIIAVLVLSEIIISALALYYVYDRLAEAKKKNNDALFLWLLFCGLLGAAAGISAGVIVFPMMYAAITAAILAGTALGPASVAALAITVAVLAVVALACVGMALGVFIGEQLSCSPCCADEDALRSRNTTFGCC
ncbi:MAG: sulfite exporter TauE/SafE family protein [Gammaproteobacteria bacterium]